jgi:hypothetical protein
MVKLLSVIAWCSTYALGIFICGGLVGFLKSVRQDYSPVFYAIPLFFMALGAAKYLSRLGAKKW